MPGLAGLPKQVGSLCNCCYFLQVQTPNIAELTSVISKIPNSFCCKREAMSATWQRCQAFQSPADWVPAAANQWSSVPSPIMSHPIYLPWGGSKFKNIQESISAFTPYPYHFDWGYPILTLKPIPSQAYHPISIGFFHHPSLHNNYCPRKHPSVNPVAAWTSCEPQSEFPSKKSKPHI
jgi:hypothetical protein